MSYPICKLVRMVQVREFVVGSADEPVLSRPANDALTLIQAGVAKLLHTNIDTHHLDQALATISEVELVARQVDAARVEVVASIDRTGVHAIDGHRSAKPMVAHTSKISGAEAAARAKTARMLAALPIVAKQYVDGSISTCMARKLGRVYSNPRVRDLMVDADQWFADHALTDSYELFDLVVSEWERLADQDGAESRDARHERARNHTMSQDDEGQWTWNGSCAAYDGARINDVFEAFTKIEFDIDWQWAVDNYGDDANATHMPRTAAQRRADAFAKVHDYAAQGLAAETGTMITTDIVIDDETFERETRRLAGDDPDDPLGPEAPARDDYVSATLTGSTLPSRRAVAEALLGYLRRNVIGADGVTIDLGRRRLFTGYARLAAQLNASECYWPGCHVSVRSCQIDHLTPHSTRDGPGGPDPGGGLTNPHNAGVLCGKHNRHKERGYTVTRLPDGKIHIQRPNGTTLD